jgi:hypothetical protein
MKINEVLTEAGVMDTIKAVAQQGLISGTDNIRQTANRIASNRSVQQLADSMTKVWNNMVSQERDRMQGAGSDGTINGKRYIEMLTKFAGTNVVGQDINNIEDTNTKNEINNIIQRIQDNRESPKAFQDLFKQMIVMGLIARTQQPASSDMGNTQTPNTTDNRPVGNERTAKREIEQALDQLGIRNNMRQQIGGLVNQLSGGQAVKRTGNPAVDAFLMSMGLTLR